jgi:hypothetical protein
VNNEFEKMWKGAFIVLLIYTSEVKNAILEPLYNVHAKL